MSAEAFDLDVNYALLEILQAQQRYSAPRCDCAWKIDVLDCHLVPQKHLPTRRSAVSFLRVLTDINRSNNYNLEVLKSRETKRKVVWLKKSVAFASNLTFSFTTTI